MTCRYSTRREAIPMKAFMATCMLVVVACGGQARVEPGATKATLRSMPGWFKDPPKGDEKYVYAPATATSQDVQIALNKAQAEGRAGLATQLEVKYGALTRRFAEETGVGAG